MYYREHTIALGRILRIATWTDAETLYEATAMEYVTENVVGSGIGGDETVDNQPREQFLEEEGSLASVPRDGYDGDVHRMEDPRESTNISVDMRSLPNLDSDGILLQIPLPGLPPYSTPRSEVSVTLDRNM